MITRRSTITCPSCGHDAVEAMPVDTCQWFTVLRPKEGDCCVFCSYGDVPCPSVQESGRGGACC